MLAESGAAFADIVPAPIILTEKPGNKDLSPQSFAIEVTYKQQKVWAGTLRVSADRGANFSQQTAQSPEPCSDGQSTNPFNTVSESLRVQLHRLSSGERNITRLSVQLERPKPVCGAMGSDTISVNRSISLEQGKSVIIDGEGGVTVRVTRI